jgi:hypothetical protein
MSAQTVADAAALAAVENGEAVARELVELNRARIVSYEVKTDTEQGITVVVVIEIDGVQAHATASNAD